MSGANSGRGRGRVVRTSAGRGVPQLTPQNDPAENYESNTFNGIFGGFIDPTQPFGNYFGSVNEQPYMQSPFFGAGMQSPIQPNNPYIGGTSTIPLVYQQFGPVGQHLHNSNQVFGQPRMPSQSVHNEGAQNEGAQNEGAARDRQSPAPESEVVSTTDKIYLKPDGDTFVPYEGVVQKIVESFASKYPRPWTKWKEIPQSQRDIWFNEFKKHYYWHPDNEVRIRRNFEFRGATRLRDILGYARKHNKRPKWLSPSVWNEMLKHWSEDDEFKKLSEQNKKNRLSDAEGYGPSLHTCGSIPMTERRRRLARTLGREPTWEELFKDTHCKAKDKEFVDKKSAKKYEEHHKKWEDYTQTATQGGSQLPPMTPEQLWLQENLDKKGRVYGFGTEGAKLKKSATIAAARHSSAEHFDPRHQAQLLNESIAKQAEAITEIAKKQGKTDRFMKKIMRFLKGQSAGSSSKQVNLDSDGEHDSHNDNDDSSDSE